MRKSYLFSWNIVIFPETNNQKKNSFMYIVCVINGKYVIFFLGLFFFLFVSFFVLFCFVWFGKIFNDWTNMMFTLMCVCVGVHRTLFSTSFVFFVVSLFVCHYLFIQFHFPHLLPVLTYGIFFSGYK